MALSLYITLRLVALCLVPLATCEHVWTKDHYQQLKIKWDRCNFPPNGTRTDDILGICTRNISSSTHEDEALPGIIYLCSLFEKYSNAVCKEDKDYETSDTSKFINNVLSDTEDRKFYKLCEVGVGFRISDSVMKMLGGKTCTRTCSAQNAEKLCQLIVIFSLADYKHMEDAVKDLELTTTTETQTTVDVSVATTGNSTNKGNKTHPTVTSNEMITISEAPTERTKTKTTNKTTTEPAPTTSGKATKRNKTAGYVTNGQLAIYGISFFLLCAIIFATYKYRHSILSCLRDNQTVGPPVKDGKGGYRKVPNFERVLPNMEDREKAKSFIY